MRRILLSVFSIAFVIALAVGATLAQFSDTETAYDNTFAAGTLDLKVDGEDDGETVVNMSLTDMKPGDSEYHSWVLSNEGTVAGQPSIEFSAIDNYDNACIEPEGDLDSTCGDPGLGEGELGSKLYVQMHWRQPVGSGSWQQINLTNGCGNPLLNGLDGITAGLGQLTGCFDNYGFGNDTALPVLGAGEEVEVRFHPWWHYTSTDNIAQSDSAEFDIIFHLDQAP